MTTIYTAGPIDLATNPVEWRPILVQELEHLGVQAVIFDPASAFSMATPGHYNRERSTFIEFVNNHALESSKYFVALLPKSQFSMGTPIEIKLAGQTKMPECVFVITDIPPGRSVYLDNSVAMGNIIKVDDFSSISIEMACAQIASNIQDWELP